ncbi:carboxypeptidase-like regulatory domain-containing protein [Singulisphaera sp. PoT]|uniref:carboxypeptidase-like regulatory domain-containing protein n=1 Tax=Singulisphaera sp. PoT TaxID=3411797 RepID=UPI003BF46A17
MQRGNGVGRGSMMGRALWLSVRFCILMMLAFEISASAAVALEMTSLKGIVVDEEGKPVGGVRVSSRHVEMDGTDLATTGDDGTFAIAMELMMDGRIFGRLKAEAADGRLGFLAFIQKRSEPVRIVLKAPKSLAVQVKDRGGKPVAGASLAFIVPGTEIAEGMTDAEGWWRIKIPADAEKWEDSIPVWWVSAWKSGVGFDYAGFRQAPRGPLRPVPETLTLKLDGARRLRIKAVDLAGKPVAGIRVSPSVIQKAGYELGMINAIPWGSRPITQEDGVAVIDWLPEALHGPLGFRTRSEDWHQAEHETRFDPENPVDELVLTQLPVEELSGRVTHADGRPAAGIMVWAYARGSGTIGLDGNSRTDAEGRYRLRACSEQSYVITASGDGLAAPYKAGVVLRAGKPVDGLDFVVGRGTQLRGRLTIGRDGRPVPEAFVTVSVDRGEIPEELRRKEDRIPRHVMLHFWKQTEKDGTYEFLLGPGDYRLQGPKGVKPIEISIPVQDPPAEIIHDLRIPPPQQGDLKV